MKRSIRCDYALRVILELSHHYDKKLVRVSDLAESQCVPLKYLEQIMMRLKKTGMVESKKGPNGGYSLAKPPNEVFLGDILRLVDQRLFTSEQSESLENLKSPEAARNSFFGVWAEVQGAISSVLDSISLEDIQKREKEVLSRQKNTFVYYI